MLALTVLLFALLSRNVCLAIDCTSTSGPTEQGIIFATVNSTIQLNCSSSTVRDAPIAWYKNNVPISNATLADGRNLVLSAVSLTQSGWYTCSSNGRLGEDFLLVVGDKPNPLMDTELSHTVQAGSRVELGCVSTLGFPSPNVVWNNGFSPDPVTNSLVIANFSEADAGNYSCKLCNQFGTATSQHTMIVSSMSPVYTSPLDNRPTPIEAFVNQSTIIELQCTGMSLTDLDSLNYTVQWFKDFQTRINKRDQISFDGPKLSDSGYYCCHVRDRNDMLIDRRCVTLWVKEPPQFMPTLPDSVITLPSGAGRKLLLGCSAVPLRYDTPRVTWSRDGKPLINFTGGVAVYGNAPVGFNYASVSNVSIEDGSNHTYTCTLNNSLNEISVSTTVMVVELCEGRNIVMETAAWVASNGNAIVNNERMLQLDYSEPGTVFTQTLNLSLQATAVHVSGRMRQVSANPNQRGTAALKLTAGGNSSYLCNPDNKSEAWQWVGQNIQFSQPVDQVVLQLLVLNQSEESLSGMAFFDNLCVSITAVETELPLELIIGVSVGGGSLVLLLLLTMVCCCCCLCLKRNKKQTNMMKKMSVKFTPKWSRSLKKKATGNPAASSVALQSFSSPPLPAENNTYENVERSDDYTSPENYDYINRPGQSPSQQIVVSNSDGQYTALDPTSMDEHEYVTATPVSHRSVSSLHDPNSEYVEVRADYLQVLPPTHPIGSLPVDIEEHIYDNDARNRSATTPIRQDSGTKGYLQLLAHGPTHSVGSLPANVEENIYDNDDVRNHSVTSPAECDSKTNLT